MKVFISGSSGTGKTTLAKFISREFGIPFISGSAKDLWPKYKIFSHEDLIHRSNWDKKFGLDFQVDLLKHRMEKLKGLNSFVSDRGPIDNLVYFLMQVSYYSGQEITEQYINDCIEAIKLCDHQIALFAPSGKTKYLENDGMRVNNTYYQAATESVFNMVLSKDLLKTMELGIPLFTTSTWGFYEREQLIRSWLNSETK